MNRFEASLKALEDKGRRRAMRLPEGLDMSSNDYLGLAGSDYLRARALEHLQSGIALGAGGSRLLRGHMEAHAALEEKAAAFLGADAALYFSSGFQTNMAVMQTLPSRHDVVIYDALIHASMRDGIEAGHAKSVRAAHNDVQAFEAALKDAAAGRRRDGQIWLAVEALYSMDGDFAPLDDLAALANQYDAFLIVDEAHSVGVYGPQGAGVSKGLKCDRLVSVYTCGKALGVAGALVCADRAVIDYLVNKARGFIFSTAPMPLQAALVSDALDWVASSAGADARDQLAALCARAQALFGGAGSPIVPILVGADAAAVALSAVALQAGYDVRAVRPPSVPEGSARLRLSLSAVLGFDDLQGLADHLLPALKDAA